VVKTFACHASRRIAPVVVFALMMMVPATVSFAQLSPASAPASLPAASAMPAAQLSASAPSVQLTPMLPVQLRPAITAEIPPASRPTASMPTSQPASRPTGTMPTSAPASAPAAPISAEAKAAQKLYEQGLALLNSGDLLGARVKLSAALSSGVLPAELQSPCRLKLTEIAQKIVFSPQVFPGDQDSYTYTIKRGDVLVNIVKREKLCIGEQIIQRINGIADVRKIRTGQQIKLIRGPFDAIVTKHSYLLDLYHQGMFVKSYRIGLGLDGKTPVGHWMVKPGGRVPQAPWTSPVGGKIVYFGQEGYPLGRNGYWIGLVAADAGTQDLPGFGIHGTNQPDSIGRDASSGCIRLLDEDIEELFGLLYDGMSKVEVRP
jgi:hypothetical protein